MVENFAVQPSQEQILNSLSEIGSDWEGFSDYTGSDNFSFEGEVANHIEDTLASEGIQTSSDLEGCDTNELIEAVDKRVKQSCPHLATRASMNHFGANDDIWEQFRHKLEPKYLEAPSDKVQQEQIAEAICDMEELEFDNWTKLSVKGKVEVLNKLEQQIADIEHRPAATIRAEEMDPDLNGYELDGEIALNKENLQNTDLSPENLEKVLETMIHEGRHAYQEYNVNERMVHSSEAQVESWRENYEVLGYASGDPIYNSIFGFEYTNDGLRHIGARLYYYQPVEIDARQFAADTMSAYRAKLNA